MTIRFSFTLILLVAAPLSLFAITEENVQKTLPASPGGKLVLDVDFGTIEVSAGLDTEAVIKAQRKLDFRDETREKEFFAATPLTITQEGNVLTIRARRPRNIDTHWGHHTTMDGEYVVHVPKTFNVDLNTKGGTVSVAELAGNVKTDTSGGNLHFTRIRGPIDGRTSGGNVELADCDGTLRIHTSGGNIASLGGSGTLDAHTSGGSVTIQNFGGAAATDTSGGNLKLDRIGGRISGKTSGGSINATLSSPVAGDVMLETSAGTITVAVPSNAGLDVDAEANAGNVSTDLPITSGRSSPETLRATINGGGKALYLRTSAGSIHINARTSELARR